MRLLFVGLLLSLLTACKPATGPEKSGGDDDPDDPIIPVEEYLVAREYWGEWRYFAETSGGYYFASDMLFYWDPSVVPPATYAERVAASSVTKYAPTNAKGAPVPTFSACAIEKIAGEPNLLLLQLGSGNPTPIYRVSSASTLQGRAMSGSPDKLPAGRALMPAAGISLIIRNALNNADVLSTRSDDPLTPGGFSVVGALAGDNYVIGGETEQTTPVSILPGETDAGLVPIPTGEAGDTTKALPKLVIEPLSFEHWRSADFTRESALTSGSYRIENPGTEEIASLSWAISCTTGGAVGTGASGVLSAPLAAGAKTATMTLDFTPAAITADADYVYELFQIEYTMGESTWTDSFKVRIYREASLQIRLTSPYASAMIRSPVGTTAFLHANNGNLVDPAYAVTGVTLPYIRGEWQVVVSEPYRNSSWSAGTPYSWSAGGPLFSKESFVNIDDPNEPNDGPAQATAVELGGVAYGELTQGDYDFFTLTVPAPASATAAEPESLALPATGYPQIVDLALDLDDAGAAKAAALWYLNGQTYNTALGSYERNGGTWSGPVLPGTTPFYATGVALEAESGGASFLIQCTSSKTSSANLLRLDAGTWSSSSEYYLYNTNVGFPLTHRFCGNKPIALVYEGSLSAPVSWQDTDSGGFGIGLLGYDGSAWQVEDYATTAAATAICAVPGPKPALLYMTGATSSEKKLHLGQRESPGDWTMEELAQTYKTPSFASRDADGSIWLGWSTTPSRLERIQGASAQSWLLPPSTPIACGLRDDGRPWVIASQELTVSSGGYATTSYRIWILTLGSPGAYGAELLFSRDVTRYGTAYVGLMPLVRALERDGTIRAVWAIKDSTSTTEANWEVHYTERAGGW